jgi:predicted AAA+ superfamily ATPase
MPDNSSRLAKNNIQRRVAHKVAIALTDTRVVLVTGPRQAGKSTLVRTFETDVRKYYTLDDAATLAAVRSDPIGFIRSLNMAIIDEIQRAPELMLAIKESVDNDPRPGRFLLTGSTNVMALPTIGDSLAGRIALVTLLPFAQAEILGAPGNLIDRLFGGEAPDWSGKALYGKPLIDAMMVGGYPEAVRRADPDRRHEWLRDYLALVLDRNVQDVANIEQLGQMPRLMGMLAEHVSQLTVAEHLASPMSVTIPTAQKYITILERLYLLRITPAWHSNKLLRLLKTPKTHFIDTGLLTALRGETSDDFGLDRSRLGAIAECFAVSEVMKQLTWSKTRATISHFRTKDGYEVDMVIEDSQGRIVGIEVKAGATLNLKDFTGLKKLQEAVGDKFVRGLILHDHDRITPVKEKIQGAPLSLLWQM